MNEEMNTKFGSYDWIVDFDSIQTSIVDTLQAVHQGKQSPQGQCILFQNSLIVGCGTSQVSRMLLEKGLSKCDNTDTNAETRIHFEHVVSVDILEDCIRHMATQGVALDIKDVAYDRKRLTWLQCDMLNTQQITDLIRSNKMPACYDFIFDKGTFDAILVEGVVHQYVINVYNLLMPSSGIFCMVSLHDEGFLRPFLSSPLFNLHVVYAGLPNGKPGCIAVCVRKSNQLLDEHAIAILEENVMNNYFKEQSPLFSQQEIIVIIQKFDAVAGQNHGSEGDHYHESENQRLALPIAYDVLFGNRPELGYSYSLFLEDIKNFQLVEEGSMNAEEAIAFIKSME